MFHELKQHDLTSSQRTKYFILFRNRYLEMWHLSPKGKLDMMPGSHSWN